MYFYSFCTSLIPGKVFVTYEADNEKHVKEVINFVALLRHNGFYTHVREGTSLDFTLRRLGNEEQFIFFIRETSCVLEVVSVFPADCISIKLMMSQKPKEEKKAIFTLGLTFIYLCSLFNECRSRRSFEFRVVTLLCAVCLQIDMFEQQFRSISKIDFMERYITEVSLVFFYFI